MNAILYALSDYVWLPLLECAVLVTLLIAIWKELSARLRRSGAHATVKRGEKSLSSLLSFFGMSIIIISIVNSSEIIINYKVVISIANVAVITYLNFFNSYFRNKIIGWIMMIQQFEEKV